jgi:hypothetical protein
MIGVELPVRTVDELARTVRALGGHRYVAGRCHMVHVFAYASLAEAGLGDALGEATAWAQGVLSDDAIDVSSRDERLWRSATDAEVAAVLEGFLRPDLRAFAAKAALEEWLERAELPIADADPFDESVEEHIHPLLVDAGWELLPLLSLDRERHKGAIGWFGEPIQFEAARFEEESAIPPPVYLQELPAFGPVELLLGADETGALAEPLTLWIAGNETYHEYVLAGVKRAAKLGD